MVGFGPEDEHFVVELTYNYNISQYKLGNDFQVNSQARRGGVACLYVVSLYSAVKSINGNDKCSEIR